MYLLYNILIIFLFILYLPVACYKWLKGKYREGFLERFGFLSPQLIEKFKGKDTIWVHAVSVGETVAASSVVSQLKKTYPDYKILFSTVTDTGQKMAKKVITKADAYIYFPFDFPWVVKKVLKIIKPQYFVIIETELWPNFLRIANKLGVKTMLANGRISDGSAKKYKYLGPLMKDMLSNVDIFAMQSQQDVEYILSLGAHKNKVFNTGNTKYDQSYAQVEEKTKKKLLQEFKLNEKQAIIIAGSTHPNEEEQLINVFTGLKKEYNNLLMILAPRHINRCDEIEDIYNKEGINVVRRTKIDNRDPDNNAVILLDTIGELGSIYSLGDLIFVGGSLIARGGHNILEPAAHGKVVFFGKFMFNFKDSTKLLLDNGVGIQVNNKEELEERFKYYLKHPKKLRVLGEKAFNLIEANKGATTRILSLFQSLHEDIKKKR